MRSLITVLLLVCSSLYGQANLGVLGGVSSSDLHSPAETDRRTGFTLGLIVEKEVVSWLPPLVVQAVYAQKGVNMAEDVNVDLDYLDLLVAAKLNIGPLYSLVGVQEGLNIKAQASDPVQVLDIGDSIKNLDFGPVLGLGVDLQHYGLFLEAQYFHGILNVNKASGELNNRVFKLTAGIAGGI